MKELQEESQFTDNENLEDEESESDMSGNFIHGPIKMNDLDDEVIKYLADQSDRILRAETTVYQKLNKYVEDIDKKISNTISFINKEFEKDCHKNAKFMKNIRLEFDQEIMIRKREKNDFMKEMRKVGEQITDTYSIINSVIKDFEKIRDLAAWLLEDIQIQHALDIQDEIDKK